MSSQFVISSQASECLFHDKQIHPFLWLQPSRSDSFSKTPFVLTAHQVHSDGKFHKCVLTSLSISLNESVNKTDPKLYYREIHWACAFQSQNSFFSITQFGLFLQPVAYLLHISDTYFLNSTITFHLA